jgi:hypothetical protein
MSIVDKIIDDCPGIKIGRDWEWIYKNVPLSVIREFVEKAKETFAPEDYKRIVFVRAGGECGGGLPTVWVFRVKFPGGQWTGDETFRFERPPIS